MDYWDVRQAAEHWDASCRWVQRLAACGRVPGAVRQGHRWLVPVNAPRPVDARRYRYRDVLPALREQFAIVDALRGELRRRRPLTPPEVARLRREFAVEYTYDSNAIEGSTLTLRETALVLEGLTVAGKPLREHLDAVGHRDAYDFIEELAGAEPGEPVTPYLIRQVHALVLTENPEARGVFRTIPVRILGTTHRPPEPVLVPQLVDELLTWAAADRRHPLQRAAEFHLRFEAIHPFLDGNGRTGRLLLNLMLLRDGYLPINIAFADRQRYYSCLQTWDDTGDAQPMVEVVCVYEADRLRRWLGVLDSAVSVGGA